MDLVVGQTVCWKNCEICRGFIEWSSEIRDVFKFADYPSLIWVGKSEELLVKEIHTYHETEYR